MKYVKIIRISGGYFAREFEKHGNARKKTQYREVDERTVVDHFIKGDATIEVIFEDSDRKAILLNPESDPELIKRYLGSRFLT
ncbi:MAG TPA: hypothetical protein PLL98_06275 [Bacillota bacterium]|nr:hypothetical protein [Bacillota bacterium]HPL54110.1 hypothetical protein [Bacillota bacterium]